jgi:hypothetical protein
LDILFRQYAVVLRRLQVSLILGLFLIMKGIRWLL